MYIAYVWIHPSTLLSYILSPPEKQIANIIARYKVLPARDVYAALARYVGAVLWVRYGRLRNGMVLVWVGFRSRTHATSTVYPGLGR